MRKLTERREEEEEGFTLIELMVVVLIMGILMAIAIPTFLSTTNGANKSAATSNLTNALTDAKSIYDSSSQNFGASSSLVAALSTAEPNFTFTTGAAVNSTNNAVSVYTNTAGTEVVLAAQAKGTNTCYYIDDIEQTVTASASSNTKPGTYYGSVTPSSSTASSGCAAAASANPAPAGGGAWSSSQSSGWSL